MPATSVTVLDSTTLSVVVPTTATSGSLTLTTASGTYTTTTNIVIGAATVAPAITGFTPTIGTDGVEEGTAPTEITITGTGFSSVPTENKVALNGQAMLLVSATSTALVIKLPAGATSGRLSVTTPYGKATTPEDFYIEPSGFAAADVVIRQRMIANGASFTGNFAATNKAAVLLFEGEAGKAYGIGFSGSAFISAIPYSTAYVLAPDGSVLVTKTTLSYSLASSLTLPALKLSGTYSIILANSAQTGNFTVTVSEDQVEGPLILDGGAKTIALAREGQNARTSFSGVVNQRVYLKAVSETFPNASVRVTVYMPAPDGSASMTNGSLYSSIGWSTGSWTDLQILPTTGIYTIAIDPNDSAAGSITFEFRSVPADVSAGVIVTDAGTATITTVSAAQNGLLTFDGTANQRVYLRATYENYTNDAYVTIYLPALDGSASMTNGVLYGPNGWSANSWTDVMTLPATGVYTIYMDPLDTYTGSMTLELITVPPDITGTISPGGPAVTLTTTVGGQNGVLTFIGTANQVVNLHILSETISSTVGVTIYKPAADGSASLSNGSIFYSGSGIIWTNALTLPLTGTYTILFDPGYTSVGSITSELLIVPPDASGTITIDGQSAKLTTTVPGQNGRLTFTGTVNQRIALQATAQTYGWNVGVAIYKPAADGSASTQNGPIYYYSSGNNGWFAGDWTDVLTLPATGTYTIYADPKYESTGSITFKLTSVAADKTGTLTLNGTAVKITLNSSGQNARYTFTSTATGQQVTVKLTNNTIGSMNVYLRGPLPATTLLQTGSGSAKSFNLPPATLTAPAPATYEVEINPTGTNVGSVSLKVSSP